MKKVSNYSRFYACLKAIQTADKDELKESLVSQFTGGRTNSLRNMRPEEYHAMCDSIDPKKQEMDAQAKELRRHRSMVLRKMQELGINTLDWDAVDTFCQDKRIAGKPFRRLELTDLKAIKRKLIAIGNKQPKPKRTPKVSDQVVDFMIRASWGDNLTIN